MLPKQHRFASRDEIREVFQRGRRKPGATFSIIQHSSTQRQDKPWRVAVIVSKKVAPLATKRNKIRRTINELVWSIKDSIQPGTDMVILVRTQLKNDNQNNVKSELSRLLGG